MTGSVFVKAPLNLHERDAPLFVPYQIYQYEQTKIKRFRNVFVTHSGLSVNRNGLIKESHHSYSHQLLNYQNEAAHYYYIATENSDNLITLDEEDLYLQIHHPWYNYFHWITEPIFRLWAVRRQLDKMVLILPERYKRADFIMGSLEPFKIKNIFFIPEGKSLLIRNLCLPQIKPVCDSFNPYHLEQIRKFYTKYVLSAKRIIAPAVERVYISRELAGRRKVVNEDAILRVLAKYGFQTFYPEKWCFLEQVAYFSKIKFLIGTHGSGLTNILFMPKGSSLLELHKDETNELDHPSPLFWYMSDALKINYYQQLCETVGQEDYFTGDYWIDLELLEINIRLMLGLS